MIVKCFVHYTFLIIFLLQIFMCYFVNLDPAPKSGPYKSTIVSVNNCIGSRPLMKNPPFIFQSSISNISGRPMLNGTLTVLRDVQNVKSKMKNFMWHDGKWVISYMMNNMNCHSTLIYLMNLATGVKYDRKKCMYLKGTYTFNNLDVNQLQHLWLPNMEYGKSMWRVEAYLDGGTMFCKEMTTSIEPAPS